MDLRIIPHRWELPVLFVSLAAHAAQFAFLVFFENPREFPLSSLLFIEL
jgi:hypothetical protein